MRFSDKACINRPIREATILHTNDVSRTRGHR
jgi:hypothetical protein